MWPPRFPWPGTTKLCSGEDQDILVDGVSKGEVCSKREEERLSIYVTRALWLSGLLADHRRAYSVSRGPAGHRIPTQTPQNRADRGIIPDQTGDSETYYFITSTGENY
ncbi:MAG: hypothetical protein ACLQPD_12930 [Desulfomonilaceae bacterium]